MGRRALCFITILLLIISGCGVENIDPNAANEEEVLGSRSGIIAASIGVRAYYTKSSLLWIIENNALSSREVSVTSSFQSARELEEGSTLTSFNSNIQNLWASLLKVHSMTDAILQNLVNVTTNEEEKRSIEAHALFYKAIAIGSLSQFFTHVPLEKGTSFLDRNSALEESVRLLEDALVRIQMDLNTELVNTITGESIDLENSIRVYLSRYHLFLGNYDEVIAVLEDVDPYAVSLFSFSSDTPNPIYGRVFGSNQYYQPIDNFGLSSPVDPNDNRVSFLLESSTETSVTGRPIEILDGFFSQPDNAIPVYFPSEICLNRAEAFLGLGSMDDAVDMLNIIRQKDDDPLSVNAELGQYEGEMSEIAIKAELFHQRSIELFMSGLRLEDSRRLGRPNPTGEATDERSRNFYPFPNAERINNPNTPNDPPI